MNDEHHPSTLTKPVWRRGGTAARLLAAAWSACGAARAEDVRLLPPVIGTSEVYLSEPRSALALGGYDPVTYWLPGGPRPGSAAQELIWRGVVWRFAGPANRAAFLRDPDTFLPRVGGYDAAAAAEGGIVQSDPGLFLISGGRLYLFRTEANRRRFEAEELGGHAETHWPELSEKLAHG